MAERFFSTAEQRMVRRDGSRAFLASWVLREAYAKATGEGFWGALDVDGAWTTFVYNRVTIATIRGKQWIVGHRVSGDYDLALAWQPSSASGTMQRQADAALEAAATRLAGSRTGT
jgi:phosphopantetheinyl transferase